MNYELALALEDAGWGRGKDDYCPPSLECCEITLEELIEACTNTMEEKCIYRLEYDWFERSWEAKAGTADEHYESYGKTPTEAVARLWLALKANTPTV